jgi:hypothetical protein
MVCLRCYAITRHWRQALLCHPRRSERPSILTRYQVLRSKNNYERVSFPADQILVSGQWESYNAARGPPNRSARNRWPPPSFVWLTVEFKLLLHAGLFLAVHVQIQQAALVWVNNTLSTNSFIQNRRMHTCMSCLSGDEWKCRWLWSIMEGQINGELTCLVVQVTDNLRSRTIGWFSCYSNDLLWKCC